jgi:hypothetical protein
VRVEPRAASIGSAQTFIGMTLKSVRQAQKELVVSFEGDMPLNHPGLMQEVENANGRPLEAHLICQPEANVIQNPRGGDPIIQLTGMKFEIGTGPMTILSDFTELSGPAAEILGKEVVQARHDSRNHIFALQFGAEYGLLITMAGLSVLYTKSLEVEFRKPLVTQ